GLLSVKRVEILHELLPTATSIAYLMNPGRLEADAERSAVQDAARSYGLQVHVLPASSEREIDAAFASLPQLQARCPPGGSRYAPTTWNRCGGSDQFGWLSQPPGYQAALRP